MISLRARDLGDLTDDELEHRLADTRQELFNLRFQAATGALENTTRLKLAKLPRNSSKVRIHHRCELSGRSKGFYRKTKLSRIALRDLANFGQIPGMTKASW